MTDNFVPFGAQYYRAPTPRPECWKKDLQNINKAGFNAIKIWAQWRWNNPKENEYYFSDLDQLMDLAYQNGLYVIINVIFDAAPAWFYIKYPESIMLTADGRRVGPQTTGYRQIGGAPGPCYHNKEGIHYRKLFLDELVKHFNTHPALYIWDLWNEPELTCGIFREPNQEDMVCYCSDSVDAFAIWLKQKYFTIEELNKCWNRNYSDWGEIEAPKNSHVFNDMIDWRTFFAHTLINELKLRVETVKKRDSVHAVMVHTVPYFNMINACSDDYGLAKLCDVFGNSVGSHPYAAAYSTSCAPGKMVINSELHALSGSTYDFPKVPSFEEMKKHIFIPLARGIKGFLFWQYRPETLGIESPAWGLTTINGEKTDWLEYCIKINNVIKEHEEDIIKAQPLPARIAIVNGSKNQLFDWCVSQSTDKYYHSVYGTFIAMYNNNYNVDIISTEQIDESVIDNYQVIYYPFPYYIEHSIANKLRQWVEQGGTLISEAFFGAVKDSDGLYSECIPGYGFDEVFGVKQGSVATISSSAIDNNSQPTGKEYIENSVLIELVKDLHYISSGECVKGYFFIEELIPDNAEVLARFSNGKAAITSSQYGKGKGIMIGSLIGYQNEKKYSQENGRMICSLIAIAGVSPYIEVDKQDIRLDLLATGKNSYILIINNTGKETDACIQFKEGFSGNEKIVNAITGEKALISVLDNHKYCQIRLKHQACELYIIR